jgi:hypothetical protein
MKLFAVLLGALALVAGFTGGLRAYSTSANAGPPVPAAHIAVHHYPPAQVVRPGPVVKWAPCVKPAVRVGKACVTHVTHTVALPAPVVSAPPTSTPAPSTVRTTQHHTTTQQPTRPHDDDGGHDDSGGEDDGDDGGHDD